MISVVLVGDFCTAVGWGQGVLRRRRLVLSGHRGTKAPAAAAGLGTLQPAAARAPNAACGPAQPGWQWPRPRTR
eukprot:2623566-Alexandrium_andersonii.AAC.1